MIGASRAPGLRRRSDRPSVTGPNEVFLIGPRVLSAQRRRAARARERRLPEAGFNRAHDRPDSEFFYPRTDAGPFLERGILTIGFTTGIHARYHLPADEARPGPGADARDRADRVRQRLDAGRRRRAAANRPADPGDGAKAQVATGPRPSTRSASCIGSRARSPFGPSTPWRNFSGK